MGQATTASAIQEGAKLMGNLGRMVVTSALLVLAGCDQGEMGGAAGSPSSIETSEQLGVVASPDVEEQAQAPVSQDEEEGAVAQKTNEVMAIDEGLDESASGPGESY